MSSCSDRYSNLGLELLLVLFGVVMTVGFLLTFIIAVDLGHVSPYLPYISDTGGKAPESCVFTFISGLGTIILLLIVCLRYRHLHHYYHYTLPWMHCLNVISLLLGAIFALGLLLVGSFQDKNVLIVHFIGAFMAFGGGILYSWVQSVITLRLWRSGATPYVGCCLVTIRFIVSLFATLMLVTTIVAATFAGNLRVVNENKTGTFYWEPGDGGYALHSVSTATEWLLAISLAVFVLTFHPDFKRVRLSFGVDLKHEQHRDVKSIISTDETTPLNI